MVVDEQSPQCEIMLSGRKLTGLLNVQVIHCVKNDIEFNEEIVSNSKEVGAFKTLVNVMVLSVE